MQQREKFGSRLGFILVSAGCAIGLGNVWKFPYICGQYGGAAFILIYLVFLVLLGFPILMCEFAVGRASGYGTSLAFDTLEQKGSKWHHVKWATIIGSYLLMMFYTMVGGWMLFYAYRMLTGKLQGLDVSGVHDAFTFMQDSAGTMTFWMILAVLLSFGICALGLQNGIEKMTKIMMSILLVLMVVLAIHSLVLPNAEKGVEFYLIPNFASVKENGIGNVIFAAMSHAFFTLSVGMGTMEIFGSYLNKERSLLGEAKNIVIIDTLVALMAGFIIIPACFAFGVEPDKGPSLLFVTLPNVFNHMAGGRIWGTAFFIFMSFAALSTIVAVFENIIAFYMDMAGWERKKAVAVNLFLVIALSMPAVLGYNVWSGIRPMGADTTIMDFEDFIVSYNLLPLGSMIFVLFCVKRNGWGFENFLAEVNTGKGRKVKGSKALRIYMTYVLPFVITIIYLKGYYDTFVTQGRIALIVWMSVAVILLIAIYSIVLHKPKKK